MLHLLLALGRSCNGYKEPEITSGKHEYLN